MAFESQAGNLVPGDTNGQQDIFVRDRLLGTTERVTVNSAGLQSTGNSAYAAINADGRFVHKDGSPYPDGQEPQRTATAKAN